MYAICCIISGYFVCCGRGCCCLIPNDFHLLNSSALHVSVELKLSGIVVVGVRVGSLLEIFCSLLNRFSRACWTLNGQIPETNISKALAYMCILCKYLRLFVEKQTLPCHREYLCVFRSDFKLVYGRVYMVNVCVWTVRKNRRVFDVLDFHILLLFLKITGEKKCLDKFEEGFPFISVQVLF